MDGKEGIINRIISDAEQKANDILNNANQVANEKKLEAQDWAEKYTSAQNDMIKKEVEETIERRSIVADLDVRKLVLEQKQQVLSEVFLEAYNKLCNVSKEKYLKLVEKLITNYADKGDTIVLSKDEVLKDKDLEKIVAIKEKSLKIASYKGDFVGGIMLKGEFCDKDLTFYSLIQESKDKMSANVAKQLF